MIKNRIVNVVLGARYDNNNSFGDAFVPRVGLTKKVGDFNFKLLYSNSFRAPGIENVAKSDPVVRIRPEKSNVAELEIGWQLNKDFFITGNLFYIETKNTIVYLVDSLSNEAYANYSKSGSWGGELDLKFRKKWGYINANYAYYNTTSINKVDQYEILGIANKVLAFPTQKVTLYANVKLTKHLNLGPSVNFWGTRYGYTFDPASSDPLGKLTKFDPTLLLNFNIGYNNLFVRGLDLSFACYDIFNRKPKFIQPYASGHMPLPGPSREFQIKLTYSFNTKKGSQL